MPSALIGNAENLRNQSWKMLTKVFVQVAAPHTKFLLQGKSLRNAGIMHRKSSHALLIEEDIYNWVPRDKLWKMLQEYNNDGHLLMVIMPLCHSTVRL